MIMLKTYHYSRQMIGSEHNMEDTCARGGENNRGRAINFFPCHTIQVCTAQSISIGCPIGSGKNGAVYLVKHKDTGVLYAAKTFGWAKVIKDRKRILRELDIQSNLEHPNILPVMCCATDKE